MQVKNISNDTKFFMPFPIAILDDKGHQYENVIDFDTWVPAYNMYSGVTKTGYFLFQDIPVNENTKLVFTLDNSINFEFDIPPVK
jgi:hypothetical protein